MPELPEVETVRRGLEREAVGREVVGIGVSDPRILKGQPEDRFARRVRGRRITAARRRGKYLLLPLEASGAEPVTLCVHFKMRGSLRLCGAQTPVERYHGISLTLDDGRELRYHDPWAWGEVRALSDPELSGMASLAGMGAEPLEPRWDEGALREALSGRRTAVKAALLDQTVVAGVGNIYADEALFRAGIDPRRPGGTLDAEQVRRLVLSVKAVLGEAVELGGSRGDYADLYGRPGRYEPRVYDRGGAPCPVCGGALERVRLGGRGTTFCPGCQA